MDRNKHPCLNDKHVRKQTKMILSKKLKALAKEQDISIASLSRHTGVPLQTIHDWLSGSSPKNLEQVKKIAG